MTELEQFIAKLEELERTMTRGQWKVDEYDGFMRVYADFDPESPLRDCGVIHCATCAPAPLDNGNAHGIAHLKNTNPTIIAMLTAAIEGLKELRTHHLAGMSDPVWGAPYHKYRLRAIDQIVAHLNTLAAEALRFVCHECDVDDARTRPACWDALARIESLEQGKTNA